ncbi:MAG: sugar kinase [Betaproteobacteria bacterium]|nr:MAG: sugar kinase [Betaproteobacteria bacterium]
MNLLNTQSRAIKPILCVGACAWTTLFRVDSLPQGSVKIIPSDALQIGDGMSASAACAIVALGGRAEFWARVGDDANGRAAIESLKTAGLNCDHVKFVDGVRGSFCSVIIDSQGERIVIPRHDPALPSNADWLPLDRIARGDFSAVLTEVRWPEGAAAVLDAARRAGIPAILDGEAAADGVLASLSRKATHALYSETGLAHLLGDSSATLDVATQLQLARERFPTQFLGVTLGAEGFYWLHREGALNHAKGLLVDAVDTLGAGDVFHGAYALALAEAMPPHDAARLACVAASLKCENFGGRLGAPSRAEVVDRDRAARLSGSM